MIVIQSLTRFAGAPFAQGGLKLICASPVQGEVGFVQQNSEGLSEQFYQLIDPAK